MRLILFAKDRSQLQYYVKLLRLTPVDYVYIDKPERLYGLRFGLYIKFPEWSENMSLKEVIEIHALIESSIELKIAE